MKITVSGKQVDVGESLRHYVQERLSAGVPKYLDRVTHCDVVISREAHQFRTDIVLSTGTHAGLTVKGRADAGDAHSSFDAAATRIEKQLRRYKRRLTNHHKDQQQREAADLAALQASGTKYVLASHADEEVTEEDAPLIIAEKPTSVDRLTVSEAVMRMDLADLPALMFFNKANGRLNTVYRRADGNISWVDPDQQAAA